MSAINNKVYTIFSESGENKYKLLGSLIYTDSGITLHLVGGEKPHIGTIVVSYPRISLKDNEKISVTTSTINVSGHKDDEIGKPIAEMFAKEFNIITVVIAGIHVDNASEKEIMHLVENSNRVAEDLISKLKVTARMPSEGGAGQRGIDPLG